MKLKGIGASTGISVAKVFEVKEVEVQINDSKIKDVKAEQEKIDSAIKETVKQIEVVKESALKNLGPEEAAVFDAHIQVASDPVMVDEIKTIIDQEKFNAVKAVSDITSKYALMFESMDDEYMKERAADIKDVAKRLMQILSGIKSSDLSTINEEVIIVAEDLTPSQTAVLNKKFVKGFATDIGGRTSHAAIMARSLEIPAVLGLKLITAKVKSGDTLLIDGTTGEVLINPSASELKNFKAKAEEEARIIRESEKFIGKESITKDGHKVKVASNIGSPNDIEGANKYDAEAIGLFRSEFLYMDAKEWPTEEEQYKSYSEVLKGMNEKQVVVRTIDIGGDKTLNYFDFPKEMNPFLGYRAIRMALDKKDIFKTQLRALVRSSAHGKLAVMFPMIATIEELIEAKKMFEDAYKEVKKEGKKVASRKEIELGMMVEVPSAAALASQFAKHVDFFSIGTNDLMQYTFAADRMNEKVSYLYQPLNPSILNLIKMTIDGAHANGKWVGMCGEMAGDPNAIPLLIGMGLDEFSMSASSMLKARMQISTINKSDAEVLVKKALEQDTQKNVEKLVEKFNKR